MALLDAGEIGADPDRSGVVFATGVGGLETLQEQIGVFFDKGPRRVSPFLIPMMMANAGAAQVSMRAGWHGPCETIATACAAGTHAIAAAGRLVATGRCDVAIGGGAEAAMVGIGLAAFSNMTALSSEGKSRPFDARRDGFVCAEGGAALILEDLEHARRRGARIYAEIAGRGVHRGCPSHHRARPGGQRGGDVHGARPRRCRGQHGRGRPHQRARDLDPAQRPRRGAGHREGLRLPLPPVTSIKGVTGHALGGAGAIEAVATTLTIDRGQIPPTAGYEEPDPEIHLDVVHGQGRAWEPAPALSNSFGFGGHNGCLVIGPPPH